MWFVATRRKRINMIARNCWIPRQVKRREVTEWDGSAVSRSKFKYASKVTCASRPSGANGEFKIYDATVAKTSLKIASSSLSIFLVLMSICLLATDVSTTCAEATRLWRWLPHRLSKRQSLTTVLLRTPINHMIFFNQGIISNVC